MEITFCDIGIKFSDYTYSKIQTGIQEIVEGDRKLSQGSWHT